MGLPINKDDSSVCNCNDQKVQIAHKGKLEKIAQNYMDAIEKDGWTLSKRDLGESAYHLDYQKGSAKLNLEVYDWQDVGVIIKKQ